MMQTGAVLEGLRLHGARLGARPRRSRRCSPSRSGSCSARASFAGARVPGPDRVPAPDPVRRADPAALPDPRHRRLKSEVFLAAFGAFWPLLVQTMYGVRDVDPLAIDTARSFGVGRLERLYRVTLPSAMPYIATGLRISSTVALILAFTAELFMGTPGPRPGDELRPVVRPERRSCTRSRSRPASSGSRSTS